MTNPVWGRIGMWSASISLAPRVIKKRSQKSIEAVRAEVSTHEWPTFIGGRNPLRPSIHQGERVLEIASNSLRPCLFVLACWSFFLPAPADAVEEGSGRAADSGLVQIEQVEVRLTVIGPVVLLKARAKAIPVFVDTVVAESIHAALSGEQLRRPLSHDLMRAILEAFEGKVSRVVISLKGDTFYADLTVVWRDTVKVFDSRSSDAIALAIHFKAPMLVSKELIETAGRIMDPPEELKPDEKRL